MTSSAFFQRVNVLSLQKPERKQMQLEEGSNCPMLAADMTVPGRLLWKGLEGICNSNWTEVTLGTKSMVAKKMIAAVKTYLPNSFLANYHRFFQDGWLKRGFVSYFSGPLEGSESQAIEILIDSVHRFSVYPIVVLHGGMATPLHWSPEVFPRLILLSMAELPSVVGLDTTLLAAAVISHVQTGILLSHNAVVFPGIDHFFAATEREINESYPYPILPVRLGEKDLHKETYWKHLCNQTSRICNQSMHWSEFDHGGLFWSTDALPFLGGLLRALLRDETYPAEAPYAPLRVRRTVKMENLLNVALWKVGASKQPLGEAAKPLFFLKGEITRGLFLKLRSSTAKNGLSLPITCKKEFKRRY